MGFVLVLLTSTCILFVMRVRMLILYGALEILAGVVTITSPIDRGNRPIAQSEKSIALILVVLGGLYIVIRGLDNVDKLTNTFACCMRLTPTVRYTKLILTATTCMGFRVI